jgi:hypothetical protein
VTRLRQAAFGTVAVLLGAALSGCGTTSGSDAPGVAARSTPTSPATRASATSFDGSGARAIVDGRRSRVADVAVVPGHPRRRIAEWYACRDRPCYRRTYALVVSSDAFWTSHVVEVGPSRVANGWVLEPAGPDHFAISPNGGRRSLVGLDGRVTAIHLSGAAGPLTGREVPLRSAKDGFEAVDPATGKGHPLSTPSGVVELQATPAGQLRALTEQPPRYSWSADGGATWHEIPLPHGDALMSGELVPTTSNSVHAILLGGENTVFTWDLTLRSTDGRAWTSYAGPRDPRGYVDDGVVLPDGRLLMNVGGWSDATTHRPSVNPVGLYAGSDWARLEPVAAGPPFGGREPWVLDPAVTSRSVTLYALTPDQRGVMASADGGRTWRAVRTR